MGMVGRSVFPRTVHCGGCLTICNYKVYMKTIDMQNHLVYAHVCVDLWTSVTVLLGSTSTQFSGDDFR